MEPEARYAWVGVSVLFILTLMIAALLWLVASGRHGEERTYRIYFARQSLEGLQIRSDVLMKGIRIGAVSGFTFSPTRPGTVEATVAVDPAAPVRESTRAVVERNLITGLAIVRLVSTTEDSPLLTTPPPGERDPVIAEGASQLQRVSESLNLLAARADETMRRINMTLSDENQAALGDTLSNLQQLSKSAGGVLARLDGTLASLGRTADELRVQTATLGADGHTLAARYDTLGAETTTSIREIAGSIRQISADVSVLSTRAAGALTDSDWQLRATARQVETGAAAVGQTARRLGDPKAALFGPAPESLGPGEQPR
jgi:phospholipid/cholesterol/gamma-HCH transport system substrate-binding protein